MECATLKDRFPLGGRIDGEGGDQLGGDPALLFRYSRTEHWQRERAGKTFLSPRYFIRREPAAEQLAVSIWVLVKCKRVEKQHNDLRLAQLLYHGNRSAYKSFRVEDIYA